LKKEDREEFKDEFSIQHITEQVTIVSHQQKLPCMRSMYPAINKLANEEKVKPDVTTNRDVPRLYINNEEVYPLLAWSWGLIDSTKYFRQAGIHILHPIIGLNAAWHNPDKFDWTIFETLFDNLLAENPDAYFLPRVLLDVPDWWKRQHPAELIECALPIDPDDKRQYRPVRRSQEGGWNWGIQFAEPSLASDVWQKDMQILFRSFVKHFEESPLTSRLLGYQIGGGIYGEWHYFLSEFLPDISEPVRKKFGTVPGKEERLHSEFGLLRDPSKEKNVIDYFRFLHEDLIAETLIRFAGIVKEESSGRLLCGSFYGYQLENVWMQEGGHLAPEKILKCADIDFIAGPYSYQTTNIEERNWWEHDIVDDVGNYLGRTRGVGGDAGYRVLLESLKRHGKLYFVEIDPNTYLEPPPEEPDGSAGTDVEKELCMVGGIGTTTFEGTKHILQRDLGRMFVSGNGGWLFDFGPVLRTGKSWYADNPIIDIVQQFTVLGNTRKQLSLHSCAQIAAVYDARTMFHTRHWRSEAPFPQGGASLDYFTYRFMDSQARSLHRIGAPVDYLYRFDIQPDDFERYKLVLMVNTFYFTSSEIQAMREMLKNSGAVVVWYYAPGFISPEKLDLKQMELLTGFKFRTETKPGPMTIKANIKDDTLRTTLLFGSKDPQYPRFIIEDDNATPLGYWTDGIGIAFALKPVDGWTSIYVGTAPLPVEILRWLATFASVELWSSSPDIIAASEDAAMLVSTSSGKRTIQLPKTMHAIYSGKSNRIFEIESNEGDVEIFIAT